jgi:transcriptional regulator with XRE-family HTH domain
MSTSADELARLVAVVDAVPELVRRRRAALGLSTRACARAVGVSAPAVLRCEQGAPLTAPMLRAFLAWLGESLEYQRPDCLTCGHDNRYCAGETARRAHPTKGS